MSQDAPTIQTPEEFAASFGKRRRHTEVPPIPQPTPHQPREVQGFPLAVAPPPTRESKPERPAASVPRIMESERFRYFDRSELVGLPDQPRSDSNVHTNLNELIDSIEALGVQTPLQVSWNASLGKYQVYDGHRRLAAIDELAVRNRSIASRIPAVILTPDQLDAMREIPSEDKLFVLSLTVNATRADLPRADRGRAYQRLIERFGVTGAARICGVSRQTIHKTLRAAEDADEHRERRSIQIDRPAWTQKQWFLAAESMVKQSTRAESSQRTLTAMWLRRLADAVEKGQASVPAFLDS